MSVKSNFRVGLFWVLLCMAYGAAHGQSASQLQARFDEVVQLQQSAVTQHADILSVGHYSSGEKNLELARKAASRGQSEKKIQRYLERALEDFGAAAATAEQAKVVLASVIAARDAAVKANASGRAEELWSRAERDFTSALQRLEKERQKTAERFGEKAESGYRQAELVAIKDELLGDARRLHALTQERRVERQAPKTLAQGQQWLAKAEQTLDTDRYNRGEAIEQASRAGYEFAHALYLNSLLLTLDSGQITAEDLALSIEQPLQQIASAVDLQVAFDNGIEQPTLSIINRVEGLREDALALNISRDRVMQLEEEIDLMHKQLGRQTDRLSRQMEKQRNFEQVEASFNVDEAQVYRAGQDILIRLTGLSFKSGEATIPEANRAMLTKVMAAIRRYPNASLVVEGHTDSYGSELMNANLSQKRADAVVRFLKQNMPELETVYIRAIGYGEARPVANNNTAEGRKANRRIDLLIKPD